MECIMAPANLPVFVNILGGKAKAKNSKQGYGIHSVLRSSGKPPIRSHCNYKLHIYRSRGASLKHLPNATGLMCQFCRLWFAHSDRMLHDDRRKWCIETAEMVHGDRQDCTVAMRVSDANPENRSSLSNGIAFNLHHTEVVEKTIANVVGHGGVAKVSIPFIHIEPGVEDGRSDPVSGLNQLQHIPGFVQGLAADMRHPKRWQCTISAVTTHTMSGVFNLSIGSQNCSPLALQISLSDAVNQLTTSHQTKENEELSDN